MEGLSIAWAVMEHLHNVLGIIYIVCGCKVEIRES